MSFFLRASFCVVFFVAFGVPTDCLHGQINYTVTGFANNLLAPPGPTAAPEVGAGESYIAEFLIDTSAVDVNPDPTRGEFAGAILASNISFSGGYVSQVDFTGGTVEVLQDFGGGGIFLNDVNGNGAIALADVGFPFADDSLVTDLGAQIIGSPASVYSLNEPTGSIISISTEPGELGFGGGTGPIALAITSASAVPEPSTACFLGLGVLTCALRRRR